ncbi:hypothetical protein ABIB25_000291 [Nakamurella sp. UYEF19]|uniref:hypothetical protein n=1 Tax=Nakamurella sp. UYEF19 TaxID=1756392 RepID=UPI003397E43D
MTTSTDRRLRAMAAKGRSRLGFLARNRRGQLAMAVLFGAIVGGGFVGVASSGLGEHDGRGGPGMSSFEQGGPHSMYQPDGNSGYDR